ncbi:MAG: extracellular solute-binding protein [Clostridiales bacterium]|jgi:putative aldouronate transport system substrate-binding protein|nr:extracellular solute-binding protein [Clostridiales bacterium]
MKVLMKLSALILAVCFILTACQQPESGTATTEQTQETTGAEESGTTAPAATEAVPEAGLQPQTFTIYIEDVIADRVEENFQGAVSKIITQDTGVTVQYQFGVGDVSEQITLMIADQAYPDFVFSRSHLNNFLEADAYIDMAPLIDQYGANIKAVYGDSYEKLKDADGHVHYLGQDFIRPIVEDPEDSFEIQHAVLKELGYPEIKTLDQAKEAIKSYIAKYPEIDGQPTIGMTLTCGEGWRYFITLINPGLRALGFPDDGNFYVNPETYEVSYAYALEGIEEYYRWMNGMYNEGLLDPDAFTQTHDEYLAKIASGRVLALTDAHWEYVDGENVLIEEGKYERTYARIPVTLREDIKHPAYRPSVYTPMNGVGITTNCPDPVRAVQFLDYLCQEKTQILSAWGIEGVHWEIKDGRRQWTAEEAVARFEPGHGIETGIGMMTYPWPCIGGGEDSNGYKFNPLDDSEVLWTNYNDEIKTTLENYGVRSWKEMFPAGDEFKASEWGQAWLIWDNQPTDSEFSRLHTECNDLTAQYLPIACTVAPEEFDATWAEFLQRLKDVGVDQLGVEATQLLADNFYVHVAE